MRIIHISDLHFGMHNPEIIEPFFEDIALLKPEMIIISGDLTQRARPEQFQQLSGFLQRLPVPQLIVPGNHDIPIYNLFSRFINPFKRYTDYISPQLEVSFSNHEVNILGVNSVTPYRMKDGALSHKTLELIKNYFSADTEQLNILFFHHNLKYFSGMHHPLNNAEELIQYLKECPIHLVCTGHLHYANLQIFNKNQGLRCVLVHAGSAFCQRTANGKNSFYFINTDRLRCSIDWRVFANQGFLSHQIDTFDFTAD